MDARGRIVRKTVELFTQRGIKSVTVDMICQELGMSKRTLYENFSDKTELVYSVIKQMAEEANQINMGFLDRSENVIEALFSLHLYSMAEMRKINTLFFKDLKKYYPNLIELFFPKINLSDSFLYRLISRGQAEGIFRSELDAGMIAEFLQNLIEGIWQSDSVIFSQKKSVESINVNILAPYFRGIATEHGLVLARRYDEQFLRELTK